MGRLAESVGCADSSELFSLHMRHVLCSMDSSYETWTQHSAQRLVFDSLVLEAGVCLVLVTKLASLCFTGSILIRHNIYTVSFNFILIKSLSSNSVGSLGLGNSSPVQITGCASSF